MIESMTNKEQKDPNLLVKDKTTQSRLIRITNGSGRSIDEGQQFISEFQRMRTMMSRMQKQMGGQMDPNAAMGPGAQEEMPVMGNRAMRRTSKKKKVGAKRGGGGFGS
jgi:signal recognition particle subunit SRP54